MFYVSCNPGFEKGLEAEIKEIWPWLIETNGQHTQLPYPPMTVEHGGILVDCPLEMGIQFNFFLKTAHRVLWRLAEFRVRDFPKMFEKVRSLPWEKFLTSHQIEWSVSASKSRLNHEKRIEETCSEAFAKAAMKIPMTSEHVHKIFVRVHDDLCSISLDSSGEHLHKRGWGSRKGEAPLRETIAAFVLRALIGPTNPAQLAQTCLVDPMCGSGTLLLEAASLFEPNFNRKFDFLYWKNVPKLFKTELWRKNYKLLKRGGAFAAYRGYDMDEKVIQAARLNFEDMQSQLQIQIANLEFQKQNLFEEAAEPLPNQNIWCVSNPPYGERLRVQGQKEFSYDDLLLQMIKKFKPQKVGLLLPDKNLVKNIKAPVGFRKSSESSFSNGGLDVVFLIFTAEPLNPPTH